MVYAKDEYKERIGFSDDDISQCVADICVYIFSLYSIPMYMYQGRTQGVSWLPGNPSPPKKSIFKQNIIL